MKPSRVAYLLTLMLSAGTLWLPATATAQATKGSSSVLMDRVIAIVNDEVITESELRQRIESTAIQIKRQGGALPAPADMRSQLLERLIVERALVQQAKEQGIRIDDATLDRAVGRIAEANGLDLNGFRDRLEAEGTPFARFREELREEIMISRLREREVDGRVTVSESEIDAFLAEQNDAKADQPEQFLVSHILLKLGEGATPEEVDRIKFRADQILQRLRSGADYLKTAAQFSEAPQAAEGSSLGWRTADRLPSVFEQPVKAMKPGDYALVRSDAGFHIIKLVEFRGSGQQLPLVETYNVRHILLQPTEKEGADAVRRRLLEMRKSVESGGVNFADLARQNSADRGTAAKGGDLGWVFPGDTVPEFERAMVGLRPGQISDPVQSQFGWHLIQVLEQKRDTLTPERQRNAARMSVRERKIEQAQVDWLRQVRDRAFVEFKPES